MKLAQATHFQAGGEPVLLSKQKSQIIANVGFLLLTAHQPFVCCVHVSYFFFSSDTDGLHSRTMIWAFIIMIFMYLSCLN